MNFNDTLVKKLRILYPTTGTELNYSSPYELIVSVILSAQCTDKKVNETTPALFKRFETFKSLSKAKLESVEKIIRPINYYRTKAKNIIAMSKVVCDQFEGQVPTSHATLMSLPGVGRKTANVVLGELKIVPCIPVDTHVFRLANRLGLSSGKKPEDVESDLQSQFKKELWYDLHHWFIYHGRRVCKAQRPLCDQCSLNDLCPSSKT